MAHSTFPFFLLLLPVVSLASLNASHYTRFQQLHDDYLLRWKIEDGQLRIGVEVIATGWVSFGLSEAGGMKGADIIYHEAASGDVVDAHALEYAKPLIDTCQDWTLITHTREDGKILLEASRPLQTGDNQDWGIIDDRETAEGHAFIAAWGDSQEISYHAEKRASGRIVLFGDAPANKAAALLLDETIEQTDLLHVDNPISTRVDDYDEYCFRLDEQLGADPAVARHVVGYEVIVDPRSASYVHHIVVYGSTATDCSGNDIDFSGEIVMSWAPGRMAATMPAEAGLRILGERGYHSLRVQTHYNNPARLAGLVDSSGLRLYHTANLRQHDIGVMQIGDPLMFLALAQSTLTPGWSKHAFQCDITQEFEVEEVTAYMRFLHMHGKGERMEVRQLRDGALVRRDSAEVYDFAQSGGVDPLSTGAGFKIRKGDTFEADCYYQEAENGRTEFGLGSADEMCLDYIYYYPKQQLPQDGACAVFFGRGSYLGASQLDTPRETGRSFGLPCDDVEPAPEPTYPPDSSGGRARGDKSLVSLLLVVPLALLRWRD